MISKYRVLLCALLLVVISKSLFAFEEYDPAESSRIIGQFFKKMRSPFESKYDISPIGTTISMPEGELKLLGLSFEMYGPLTREELRVMLVDMAEEFLEEFRSNQRLISYMKEPYVALKNVEITFYLNGREGQSIIDPDISIASVHQGYLKYFTSSISDCLPFACSYRETFEEAKRIVESKKND